MPELHYLTVRELGAALRSGETTPTELARTYMERLDTVGRRLNAVVTITEERALHEAAVAEAELRAGTDRGPLHGIPYGAKDLLAAAGYPTSWGAEPYRDQVFPDDAFVVQRLRDAGAVLVGKLAMIELAGGTGYEQPNASFTGPCMTPWNEQAWSGGSSSGSGAAVAAGAVSFAIGSETQGSIHSPANNCGVSGLRPTYGRVSRRGAMALSWTMDKLGPMCRSADDCGQVLNAIAGHDPGDPTSLHDPFHYELDAAPVHHFRFGVLESELVEAQPEVRDNFAAAVKVLEDFGTVESVSLPELPYSETGALVIRSEMVSAFEELIISGEINRLAATEGHVNALAALALPADAYLKAMRVRRTIQAAVDGLLGRFDAILSPTAARVAAPIEGRFDAYDSSRARRTFGAAVNLAGVPGIAVPNGFGERGLPTSLCITTRAGDDLKALHIANLYQSRTDWHRRYPAL